MRAEDISAVILAGGFSSRMGRNKAELTIGGRTFIELQVDKLKALGVSDIMISGYDRHIEGTRFVPDIIAHKGPLSGVHACLIAAEHDTCLVTGVDVPLVPESLLQALIEAHTGGITITKHNGRLEPLMAVYDRSEYLIAERILVSEKSRLMSLIEASDIKCCSYIGDEALLSNCNTPDDYRRILEIADAEGFGDRKS